MEQEETKMTRLKQQIRFITEIDKVKNIFRQTYLADGKRKENDAEHSWHIALMAYLLQEHAEEPVDVPRVMLMVLIHDLVEIDAGDTYAYDSEGAKTKRERKCAPRSGSSDCSRKIRDGISGNCGMNLKPMKVQMRSMHICWIIFSRFC